ncbi:MAG: 4a-hydroxytetrahydrobiopterin dehydratase [Candidatus Omnitrophica bacterium]|nr:4a-hydroxytetrahydrobiopterin dehydratase [Candidatus Omnitrophota bacterium]
MTKQPDYAAVLSKLDEVIKTPALVVSGDLPGHCKPCEGGALPLAKEKIEELIAKANGWEVIEDKKITKEFNFKDFQEAKYFLDLVSLIAEEQNHHPNFTLVYNRLKITCTTHAIGGLSENDFIIARIIEELNG